MDHMHGPFIICWGSDSRGAFMAVADAISQAKTYATRQRAGCPVAILDGRDVTIAVVTDDANGLVVHRLRGWPADLHFPDGSEDGVAAE